MSLLGKKDINVLLKAGFDESDLGLIEGGVLGVQMYESPDDYFARELIENACEQGECSIHDDIPIREQVEGYDRSRKGLWDDMKYAGNDDPMEGVNPNLSDQIELLLDSKIGKMSIWQARDKKGNFKFRVDKINIPIPEEDQAKMLTLDHGERRELWGQCAREEWKKCWQAAVDSLWQFSIEDVTSFKTKKGSFINIIIIDADNLRKIGYENLPSEAKWITLVYFEKNKRRF